MGRRLAWLPDARKRAMPIGFRCAYCNQLMGIARRKAGTVVHCPKCKGQVVVPTPDEPGADDDGLDVPQPEPASPMAPIHAAGALARDVCERSDLEKVFVP